MLLHNYNDDDVFECLISARRWHTQQEIASHLGVDIRTIRRWESRKTTPPHYIIPALKQLMPSSTTDGELESTFRFIDLFAGIGGIRIAFERIGGQCVFTSEWDSYAQKTYAENHGRDSHEIAGDITQIAAEEIPEHDVLLAGFPCQPFSIAGVSKKNALGRAHGFADETQGTLFFDVCRIIEAKKPKAFLLENVKNLVAHDKGRTFDVITRSLRSLGYDIHFRIIDGAHFVPQHRERILIVGFREPVAFDFDALPLPPKGQRTMADILHRTDGSEPFLEWDGDRFFDHKQKSVNPKYTLTPKLWQYLQNYAEKHRAQGNGFGFGLVYSHSVARTLSARYYKDGSEILVHQGEGSNPRRLTPRECARLMGFPDTFRIPVSDTRAYKQFGNSVVVDVMAHVATLMRPFIEAEQLEPELPLCYATA
jgi:DNA (cytosine-5)-methyltransferase 1